MSAIEKAPSRSPQARRSTFKRVPTQIEERHIWTTAFESVASAPGSGTELIYRPNIISFQTFAELR